MNTALTRYINSFTTLRRAPTNGGAPHKPILLLAVLQLAAQGAIERGQVFITPELVALFRSNWQQLVHTQHDCLMAMPFFHLKSSGFWNLIPKTGALDINKLSQFTKSLTRLDSAVEYAQLDVELFTLMMDAEANGMLQFALMEKYFPNAVLDGEVLKRGQMEIFTDISKQILNDDPVLYRTKMNELLDKKADEEVFLRGGVFKREVPKVYNYRCAISGMRISAMANISMIDACHIVPFAESHDDTISNGIALCPTLHRAFDRGLIAFSEDYSVLVSSAFHEQPGEYGIRRFEGQQLLLPADGAYRPRQENLEWHRERFGF